MLPVSTFIVCRDAERLLPAAVANLRQFAAEVLIVVDTATTDATYAVAQALADDVRAWPVAGSYESVLNEAANLCKQPWILYGHDDELWPADLIARLPGLITAGGHEAAFKRRHIVANGTRWITDEPWWPDWQVRLRSQAAWRRHPWPRQVHAVPEAFERVFVDAAIWHLKFCAKPAAQRAARLARWGELWATASNDHFRRFSLAEEYTWHSAELPEAPTEFAAMLAAGTECA